MSSDRDLFDAIASKYCAKDWHEAARIARKHRLMRTFTLAGVTPGGRVLEVGCGAGFGAEYLRGWYSEYVGVDYSSALIELAQRYNESESATFKVADVADFDSGTPFDVVLMIGVLHHFDDIPKALEKVRTLMRPGGMLVANEPQPANPGISLARALRKRVDRAYSSDQRELSKHELHRALTGAGFQDIRILPQGVFSTPFAEVPLAPLALSVPLARATCRLDAWLERSLAARLVRASWNLVAVGQNAR